MSGGERAAVKLLGLALLPTAAFVVAAGYVLDAAGRAIDGGQDVLDAAWNEIESWRGLGVDREQRYR